MQRFINYYSLFINQNKMRRLLAFALAIAAALPAYHAIALTDVALSSEQTETIEQPINGEQPEAMSMPAGDSVAVSDTIKPYEPPKAPDFNFIKSRTNPTILSAS